ncbi:MAG: EamA family transporter [Desulfurococcales archaeon]|nr:EamA family transporter [Desulfurococcales archaeon]MEB3806915.1 EamA family transporter [Desulfurococcales archaeon]
MGVLPRWLIPALLTFLLWGIWGVLLKEAQRGRSWQEVYVTTNTAIIIMVLVVLATSGGLKLFITGKQGVIALLAGFSGTLGYLFLVKALEAGGKISVVIPLTQLSPALTVVLGVLFLGEHLSQKQALGVVLALIAVYLLSS